MNIKNIWQTIKNRWMIVSILLFQFLVVFHAISIIYVVAIESNVTFNYNWGFTQGVIAVGVMLVVTLILNFVVFLLSASQLRTTTIVVPIIIFGVILTYMSVSFGGFMANPIFMGAFIGIYYALFFFGPALWAYFRFRMPYIAVGWLSVLFLSTILIATANYLSGEGAEKYLSLLRPDYLAITGTFFLSSMLLLLIDNSQALARWKRIPQQAIKLPLRTILPVIVVLIMAVVITNILSPIVWKVLWEEGEQTQVEKPTEKDIPDDANDGPAGNMDQTQDKNGNDKVKMDPDNELQDKLNDLSNDNGNGAILFTVKPITSDGVLRRYAPNSGAYYWKTENLSKFNEKRGFYNDLVYTNNITPKDLEGKYFDYLPTNFVKRYQRVTQIFTFHSLESQWLVSAYQPSRVRILLGSPRTLFVAKSEGILAQQNRPWVRGDSYEVESYISTVNPDLRTDYLEVRNNYLRVGTTSSELAKKQQWREIEIEYGVFDNDEIEAFTRKIIGDQTNRMDIAKTVNEYLKTNYTYTLEPGAPPNLKEDTAGYDRLHYFLFENKKGYCTYYASAMVAMLRSVGIPARVVGGFSEGTYSEELKTYVVTGNDAHAWVEVFFNDYGWITFDPTSPSIEQDQKRQQELEKELTQKIEQDIKDLQEKAEDVKSEFDKGNDVPPQVQDPEEPMELPQWLKDWLAFFDKFFTGMYAAIMLLWPLYLLAAIMLFAGLPPMMNYYAEANLLGKLRKRDDRSQIVAYFDYIERKLSRFNKKFRRLRGETSLQYYERIRHIYSFDEIMNKTLHEASKIYNKAIFRHKLEDTDFTTMEIAKENVKTWVEDQSDTAKRLWDSWRP